MRREGKVHHGSRRVERAKIGLRLCGSPVRIDDRGFGVIDADFNLGEAVGREDDCARLGEVFAARYAALFERLLRFRRRAEIEGLLSAFEREVDHLGGADVEDVAVADREVGE